MVVLLSFLGNSKVSIAVSPSLNKLCWGIEGSQGAIVCSDLNGSNPTTLLTALGDWHFTTNSLTIDAVTNSILWIDYYYNANKMLLTGGSPTSIGRLSSDVTDAPIHIVVDEVAGKIYSLAAVTDGTVRGSEVLQWNLDGSGKVTINRITEDASYWIPLGLWLNGTNVEWTEGNYLLSESRAFRVPKTGGGHTPLFSLADGSALNSPVFVPGTPGSLRYLAYETTETHGLIKSIDLDGSNEMLVAEPYREGEFVLGHQTQKLYLAFLTTIQRMNLDGSNREVLLTTDRFPEKLAVDEANGYIFYYGIDGANYAIVRTDLDGSNETVFWVNTDSDWFVTSLAVDPISGYLYWALGDDMGRPGAGVWRAPVNNPGSSAQIVTDLVKAHVAVDSAASKLYWTTLSFQDTRYHQLYKGNLDGSSPVSVALIGPEDSSPRFITGGWIYYTDYKDSMLLARRSTTSPGTMEGYSSSQGQDFTTEVNLKSAAFNIANNKLFWVSPINRKVYSQSLSDMYHLLKPLRDVGDAAVDPVEDIVYASDGPCYYPQLRKHDQNSRLYKLIFYGMREATTREEGLRHAKEGEGRDSRTC